MKKSCSKIVLVFLMVVMMLCVAASVQADTIDKTGPQGMTSSAIPLPPTAPEAPLYLDLGSLLFLWLMLFG
jgi:hypothetical protein